MARTSKKSLNLMQHPERFLVEAHGAAQKAADLTDLPQTIFYHAEIGYSHTQLSCYGIQTFTTWLPLDFFN